MKQIIKIISSTVLIALIMGPIPTITAFEARTATNNSVESEVKVSVVNNSKTNESNLMVVDYHKDCSWLGGSMIIQGSVNENQFTANNCFTNQSRISIQESSLWNSVNVKVAEHNSFFTEYTVVVENNSSAGKLAKQFKLSPLQSALEEFLIANPQSYQPQIESRAHISSSSNNRQTSEQFISTISMTRNLILLC